MADREETSRDFLRTAFADPLKDSLCVALSLPRDLFYDPAKKETILSDVYGPSLAGWTPRLLMQKIGTEGYRGLIGPKIWVDVWQRRAKILLEAREKVFVEDVRFPNEIAAIRELGGFVIGVRRPGVVLSHDHPSEKSIDELVDTADHIVMNDGTLPDLWRNVEGLL
jgi:hypothetical protein